jgi:hypothetical protein
LLPSLLALGIYTFGFPLFLFWLLRCGGRKELLKEDQILRAGGWGNELSTNPRAYHIRVRYHKMYYYYKPGKTYWMLIILGRKVGIAFCALIFRTNPGFMLATIVLLLFIAFSLQTKHSPYMSTSQRQIVLAEHAIKAEAGDSIHMRIRQNVNTVQASQEMNKRDKARRTQQRLSTVFGPKKDSDKQPAAITSFFDYNTVELVLLFCAVLVCLAGVMFESDRFKATDGAGSLRYMWQRDLVTFIVIFIVFASFVYLAIVMLNEITGFTPTWLTNRCQKRANAIMSAANTIQNQRDDHVEMSRFNPLAAHEMPRPSILGRLEAETTAATKDRAKLAEMIASQKQNAWQNEKALHKKKAGRGRNRGKKPRKQKSNNMKKDFGGKVTVLTLTDEELATTGASLSAENEKSESKKGGQKKKQSFQRHRSDTGKDYYSNTETNETTWELPSGAVLVEEGEETRNPTTGTLGKKKLSFRRLKTSENGREYYQNVDKPEETTWTVPDEAEIVL